MNRAVFGTAFVLLAAVVSAAPVPRAILKKNASLEGEWRLESEERNGRPSAQRSSSHNLFRLSKDGFTLINENSNGPDREYPGSFATEPPTGDKPGTFEYTLHVNQYRRCGVYELDGDTLRIAYTNKPTVRPDRVTSNGNGYLYTFKRVK